MLKLKELRKAKRMTQQEVAEYIGITQNNYSYWENEKVKIDNNSLKKLSEFFGVTTDYILGIEEPQKLHIPDHLKNIPVAFHGGIDGLTQEDIDDVAKYLEFIRERRRKQNKGE